MNPTQFTGLIMSGAATLSCVRAARIRGKRTWWWLATAWLGCLLETAFEWRYQLHDLANSVLGSRGWYGERRPIQRLLLVCLIMVVVVPLSMWLLKVMRTDRKAGVAALAWTGTMCLFLAESVSLHDMDAVMYTPIGPVVLIGWMWAILAGITVCMAFSAAAQRPGGKCPA